MANQNTSYEVTNLMIPAFGAVRMVTNIFNIQNGYSLDINGLIIDSIPFRPQSVTIDATDVPGTDTIVFQIAQINFKKVIQGGNNVTFNFPSISNMIINIIPSTGTPEVRAFFYNFPSFVDFEGVQQVTVVGAGGGAQDVNIVSPDPLPVISANGGTFTQSVLTVISAGVITIPANANRKYILIQNNDPTGIVYISLAGDGGVSSTTGFKILPGGSIELAEFVPVNAITLIGSIASNANVILSEGV